jgi:putative effector of murein hydrolase
VIGYVVVFAFTAYLTRGLQFLFGTSKRAMTERAEELGARNDDIPLTEVLEVNGDANLMQSRNASTAPLLVEGQAVEGIQEPERSQDPSEIVGTGGPPIHEQADAISLAPISSHMTVRQNRSPLTRAQQWATIINTRIDIFTYLAVFFLVGLPVYLTTGYAMPAQLPVNILAYFLALELPVIWRRFLHPALVASVITIAGIYILTACHGQDFTDGLHEYRTRTNYLQLFSGKPGLPKPGAGDVLSSVLDVSIVALAMPMYQYRAELKRSVSPHSPIIKIHTSSDRTQFFPIVIPTISIAILSLFGYPIICRAIGISPSRALSFPSRSLTLALATPATQNLGGDLSLVAVLCILSGIMGVVIGPQLLDLLRIPQGKLSVYLSKTSS